MVRVTRVLLPRLSIVPSEEMDPDIAAAIAQISQGPNGEVRVRLHDKHAALVSIGKHLGMFTDHFKVDAVYGISEEPMSAEEWKKHTSRKADERWRAVGIAELHWHRSHQDAQQAGGPGGPGQAPGNVRRAASEQLPPGLLKRSFGIRCSSFSSRCPLLHMGRVIVGPGVNRRRVFGRQDRPLP